METKQRKSAKLIHLSLVALDASYSYEFRLKHADTLKRIQDRCQALHVKTKYKGAV